MRKLFDTTFLGHYLTRPTRVEAYLEAHGTPETTFLGSLISLKELAVGLHHVEVEATLADLVADFEWLDLRPFTARHAFHAGGIEEHCHDEGFPQEQINALGGDILIGGVALAEDATVVSENVDDYQLMPGVHVESY